MFNSNERAYGVEELYYIRCPSCGMVLAGRIESEYKELVGLAKKEIEQKIPDILTIDEKYKLYETELERYMVLIFEKIGVKRLCCKTRLISPLQILTGYEGEPIGNTAIDRQSALSQKEGYRRSPTVISLSTYSRVPGKGGLNMMSIKGNEEYNTEEWQDYQEKVNKDFIKGGTQYVRINKEEKIVRNTLGFKLADVPQSKSYGSVAIENNYLSRLGDVIIEGNSDDMEIVSPEENIIESMSGLTLEEQINPFGTNFNDIQNLDLTYPGGFKYF